MTSYLYDRSRRGLSLVTPPTAEPITVDLLKRHIRLEITEDDAVVDLYRRVAREHVENITRRALMRQQWKLSFDRFPTWGDTEDTYFWLYRRGIIQINVPPLATIDTFTYVDTTGAQIAITPDQYILDRQSSYARIEPVYGSFWPVTQFRIRTVEITFTSGYAIADPDNKDGDPSNRVPLAIKQAILLLAGHLYENREATGGSLTEIPLGVDALLASYRALTF